ncbi:hypothetical protein ACQF36_14285 [Streptomyces sp. Marseille-Q5077]|uniref:hypothetical protein n=1 Tax=Streptomyces sp. Marseille-Q5077 TaxID=3418995 RepID=UPI003D035B3F
MTTPSEESPADPPSGSTSSGEDDEDDEDETKTAPPPEQKQALAEVTATLNEERAEVPEELTATVDTLIVTLVSVEDPATSPQDREALTDSAKELGATLAVISDNGTPGKLRKQLARIVKQMAATLKAGLKPDVSPEDRSRLFLVVERTTVALAAIADPRTPQKPRQQLTAIVEDTNYALEQCNGKGETGAAALLVSSSVEFLAESITPQQIPGSNRPDERQPESTGDNQLMDESQRVSGQMRRANDPKASPEDRAEAGQEMRDRSSKLEQEQDKAAARQGRPDVSLGKAAEVCTSAIFKAVSDRKLSKGLRDMTPPSWNSTGVKDFWKAIDEGTDMLDVSAQLENDEHTNAPFKVAPLISGLAEILHGSELNGRVGIKQASHCRQTAAYLEQEGVTVGSWLTSGEG